MLAQAGQLLRSTPVSIGFAASISITIAAASLYLYNPQKDKATRIESGSIQQWELPSNLREASGLAIIDREHVIVHNDESGQVFRVKLIDKTIDTLVTIGNPTIDADFEGIASDGQTTFLSTSTGEVFVIEDLAENLLNQHAPVRSFDTGLSDICELEGLHLLNGELLMPCKVPLQKKHENQLVVFAYNLASGTSTEIIRLELGAFSGLDKIHPTAIDATDADYYLLSGNNLILVDRISLVTRLFHLPKKIHFQPEGIAVLHDGSIIIVDDYRRGIGRLTHYRALDELTEHF